MDINANRKAGVGVSLVQARRRFPHGPSEITRVLVDVPADGAWSSISECITPQPTAFSITFFNVKAIVAIFSVAFSRRYAVLPVAK